jgi:hypothetical protein
MVIKMIKPRKNIINNKLIFRRRWPLNNYALQMTHQNIADNTDLYFYPLCDLITTFINRFIFSNYIMK